MHTLLLAIVGLMAATAVGWIAVIIFNIVKMRGVPRLEPESAALFPSDAPLVSILVPARNEASRILEVAIRSIANQDYPNFEIIVVDDRSTDDTYAILESIASAVPRVRAIRGTKLPAGWAGKPWALEQAKRASTGTWILATDADVIFEPAAVRAAMTVAFRRRLDAVTLLPDIGTGNFWTRIVMPVAAWMIAVVLPVDKTNDPSSPVALGCGGFFLIRRSVHDAIGGYLAIRDQVIDDVATARALKAAGHAMRAEAGQNLLHTPMYETLGELWNGFAKNAFAGSDHSLLIVARNAIANLLATQLPTAIAIAGTALWFGAGLVQVRLLVVAALAAYVAMVVAFIPVYAALGRRPYLAVFAGVANLVMVLILLDSTFRALSGRTVDWRGQAVMLDRR